MQRFKISISSILQNPEIQMGPSGEARHSDKPDALAGVNMFTDANKNFRKVHVHCFVAIRVRDAHQIP